MNVTRASIEHLRERAGALPRFDRFELVQVFRNGDTFVDDCERGLAKGARIQGALELAIAEGLAALTVGARLPELGYHLGDYAREVLDLAPSTALKLVRMAKELRSRPLLREALRDGEVSLRAAQIVLPAATGEDEAYWVERAGAETVRALEAAVADARRSPAEVDEEWGRLFVGATPEELAVIDDALEVAGRELGPDAQRYERLEAIAQESLGGFPGLAADAEVEPHGLYRAARRDGPESERRRAALDYETNRWAQLPAIPPWQAPDLAWDELTSAAELDATLRQLARHRRTWDEQVGWLAHQLQVSRVHLTLGFASFRSMWRNGSVSLPARSSSGRRSSSASGRAQRSGRPGGRSSPTRSSGRSRTSPTPRSRPGSRARGR